MLTYSIIAISILLNLFLLYKVLGEPKTVNYEETAEQIYRASFIFVAFLVLGATVITSLMRYWLSVDVTIVPEPILQFTKEIIYIFVIPISIKIIGDKLPEVTKLILALLEIKTAGVKP